MRRAFGVVFLCVILYTSALWGAPKKEAIFKVHEKIVLSVDDLEKGSQVLWDVAVGEADTEEVGGKIYVWAKPGRYRVVATVVNFDTKTLRKVSFGFTVQGDVPPDPKPPNPPNPPDPKPGPSPIPLDGFRVLIVEDVETRNKLPASQLAIIFDKKVRDYLDSKCVTGSDSKTKEWRIWDKDVDASADGKHWADALKRDRKSTPWILISTGKAGYEGPLPATVDETLTLLKKYGG